MSTIKGNFRIFKFLFIEIHQKFIEFSKNSLELFRIKNLSANMYGLPVQLNSSHWPDRTAQWLDPSSHWLVLKDESSNWCCSLAYCMSRGFDSRVLQRGYLSLLCFDMYPDSVKSKILFEKFRMWSILNKTVYELIFKANLTVLEKLNLTT